MHATDTLANERTYLAYIRTALAFIAFGFVIARFSLFAREFASLMHGAGRVTGVSTGFGTAMALFGIFVAVFGAWRYSATQRGLEQGKILTLSPLAGYGISVVVVAIGAIVAIALYFF